MKAIYLELSRSVLSIKFHFCFIIIGLLFAPNFGWAQDKTIERTGDVFLFALPAAAITTSLIKKDEKGTWQYSKGLLLTGALTYGLKLGINKTRPDFSNENSFPSGHTSITFQSAAFMHRRYGFAESIPFYALAGFTAFSRLNADKHDGWDILAGAVIGIGSSYLFTTPYQREHMELTFSSKNGDFLLGFKFKF